MRVPRPFTKQQLTEILSFLDEQESFVWLETSRPAAENRYSLLFLSPVATLSCTAGQSAAAFLAEAEKYLQHGCHLAGWLAYEFGYLLEPALLRLLPVGPATPLATLGVFGPPLIYDHATGTFNAPPPWPAVSEKKALPYTLTNLRLNETEARYFEKIERIKRYIAAGDTYQVNYTLKLRFDFAGSAAALFAALRRNQSVAYSAWLKLGGQQVLSFSPELFFRKAGDCCAVRPMKGTIGRGLTRPADNRLADFLRHDPKNRSENVMIVDLLRNDLGRLCQPGTVRALSMFDVETYETLHQMTSTIVGHLRPGLGLHELFQGLFPCGSVTGAPKIRTMEIIRELENEPRGAYTGAIGYLAPDRGAIFNVPIRTLVLRGNHGEMGIGSGVVSDSDPAKEWQECRLKGNFLSQPAPEFALIETLLWQPGKGYWLLDFHLERLLDSAAFLDFYADEHEIRTLLAARGDDFTGSQRVRLLLEKDGTLSLSHAPCASPVANWQQALAADDHPLPLVVFSPQPVSSQERLLYHKTTLRSLYDRERARATAAGFFDVLFRNEQEEVTEGAITSIFIRQGRKMVTPAVPCGLLPGVFRRHLLATCPLPVEEGLLTVADLEQADTLYVGNSVRGLVRVRLAAPHFLAP